jgi:HlyD family secretion protein
MPEPFHTRSSSCRGAASKVIIGVTVVILALVAVAWGVTQLGGGKATDEAAYTAGTPEWHTVQKMSFDIVVTAGGELDAKNKVLIRNEVEGKTTISDIVDEGSRVSKGDILVKLADDELKKQIEDSKELVQKAATEKIATEQTLAIEVSEADSLQRADEVKLALAKLELDKWEKGTLDQTRRKLALALVEATDNLEIARRKAVDAEELFKNKFISREELDTDRLKFKQAESALDTARKDQEIYEAYTKPQEEKKARSDVEEAAASLERTKRKNTSKIATAQANFDSAVRSHQIKADRLSKLEQQLASCTMRAPSDGVVVYATSVSSGRNKRNEPIGKNRDASFNEVLIILPDTGQMVAILKVNESRIPDIEIGQRATVTIDAMRGRTIDGTVITKATMADEGTWQNPDVRQYEVRVELPPNVGSSGTTVSTQGSKRGGRGDGTGPITLNPGMRCSGQVFVDRATDVIAVPIHAVFSEGRERFCYVPAENGRVKRQSVRIGKANETYVEVRSGLSEGDRVLLRKPKPGEVEETSAPKEKDKAADGKTPLTPGGAAPSTGTPDPTKKSGTGGDPSNPDRPRRKSKDTGQRPPGESPAPQ